MKKYKKEAEIQKYETDKWEPYILWFSFICSGLF